MHTWTNIRIRNAAHTFTSAENLLLCQSGIGAAPIDKYPTAPGTASRYCTLFLGVVAPVVACSPCSRSKSNLTAAAYHSTACMYVWATDSLLWLRRAVLPGSAATSRGRSDRIKTSRAQNREQQTLPGPVVNKCRGNDPVDLQRGKE